MKVIIVGAGLGGLACAIACRREGLEVEVLERAPEILEIGAGIQIPPNAARVCRSLGILSQLATKATTLDATSVRRYATGEMLSERPLGDRSQTDYGAPWMVIHRADYHQVLLNVAVAAGASLKLNTTVDDIDFDKTRVLLSDGTAVAGDVIIGADGLWSLTRDKLLGYESPPTETGDLAYRGTFSKKQLLELQDPRVEELCSRKVASLWMGPDRHAVFYPVKSGQEFNLVLLRPDNLPSNARTAEGSLEEMRASFEGWDPILRKIISCIPTALKWKLCHHEELESWTKGNVALMGDACHPTLPYQAQGAAMAVEDGAVLGKLLGLANSLDKSPSSASTIPEVLKLYESLRKARTTANVKGAISNRKMYHLHDGPDQERRDDGLRKTDWRSPSEWNFVDFDYSRHIMGFDAVRDCEEAFAVWLNKPKAQSLPDQGQRGDASDETVRSLL